MAENAEVNAARRVIREESYALSYMAARLGSEILEALRLIEEARMVHVSGIGKSGHVARKVAGTLCATGTRAHFLHAVEAMHGDLGFVQPGDAVVLISRSGECDEVIALADALPEQCAIIALTGGVASRLAERADVVLDVGAREACPTGLVPTSTTATSMAMGDALAVVLMQRRGRGAEDFRAVHPGGAIGAGR